MAKRCVSLAVAFLLALAFLGQGSICWGQITSRGLIGPESLAPLGLQLAWATTIEVDRGRDRVVDVTQFVSSNQTQTIYEFTFDNQLYTVSERDRDAFGNVFGPAGAKSKADQMWAQIVLEYATRGLPEPTVPTIEQRIVPEITLFATTEKGMVHAIDGNTGKTRWSTSVGKTRYPTTAAGGSDKFVAVVNGSTLHVLNAADGTFAWSRPINGAPGAGPAVSDNLVFVPRINGATELYNVNDPKRPAAVYKAFGRILVQPVTSYNSVAWPTDEGHLYVGFANETGMRFRIEAKDGIVSKPCFSPAGKLFATSLDGYVYCIDEVRGDVLWRFTTGEPIDISPVAIGDMVYAITREHSMYAINVADATEKWVVPGIGGFLSGSDERLYCTDVTGNMIVLDANSGALLGSLPTSTMTLKMPNLQTDRIFLGQTTGLLQCIRQTNLKYPQAHYFTDAKKKPKIPTAGGANPAAPQPMPAGPVIDPFADPGAAPAPMPGAPAPVDPFGDPAPAAPKPAAPMPAPVDPFG
ncbi:Outer membrane protein assembly factor BamB precursor [Anatilimnocola aggregata]|uniref:Outer membrane protein assembly factor BamB n=1 Tax=Anatilimnocola aggregata TaxID=2528021 RepID=A0A517YD49_9BACT|nr:PQQ-binding-like beta-propeller repeat protein [Anatilimnocola aggregata]QDU28157.1 Outer membrane protein assembly factor BamB precursor [Anatilimnocola aggregata]